MSYTCFSLEIYIEAYRLLFVCTSVNRCGDRVYLWRIATSPRPLESLELHDNTAENKQEFLQQLLTTTITLVHQAQLPYKFMTLH